MLDFGRSVFPAQGHKKRVSGGQNSKRVLGKVRFAFRIGRLTSRCSWKSLFLRFRIGRLTFRGGWESDFWGLAVALCRFSFIWSRIHRYGYTHVSGVQICVLPAQGHKKRVSRGQNSKYVRFAFSIGRLTSRCGWKTVFRRFCIGRLTSRCGWNSSREVKIRVSPAQGCARSMPVSHFVGG